jgi:hypothetical protein
MHPIANLHNPCGRGLATTREDLWFPSSSAHHGAIEESGIGLTIGVLLDSTIVRIIMVPATMQMAGKRTGECPAG